MKRQIKSLHHNKLSNRKLTFSLPQNFDKSIFLEFILDIIGDTDVNVDIKLDRVNIQLKGEKDRINSIAERIIRIETSLEGATSQDIDGYYQYTTELFSKIFKIQLNLEYFAKSLEILGYETELKHNVLYSKANLLQLRNCHEKAINARDLVPSDQNRDVRRFLSHCQLATGLQIDIIIDLALKNQLLGEKNNRFYFSIEVKNAYAKMMEILDHINIEEKRSHQKNNDGQLIREISEGFRGGKIVFVNKVKELDQSLYESNKNGKLVRREEEN